MTNDARTALITGSGGQDGSYLAELLIGKGYVVHGVERTPQRSQQNITVHVGDVADAKTMRRIIEAVQPDEIYHLAGQSHVGRSFEVPEESCEKTAMATLRLLEIVRARGKRPRVFHASSAEIFGNADETPQTESTSIRPTSPYGCAKAFATQIARVYREAYGVFVCNGILFNHESPRRGENFVTRKIARAVARIARGLDRDVVLGNLESRRDWGRAEDYVEAMWLMLQHETPDDYVVATGETHSVREFVEAAFEVVNLPWRDYLRQDPTLYRPADVRQLVGSSDKIRETLGWKPRGTFKQLVREMVEAELAEIDRAAA
ncbi:MAG: GDP-mannose 4,6-dehydratase [Chthoniobacterales bacterium]